MPRTQRFTDVISIRLPPGSLDLLREMVRPGESLADATRRIVLQAIKDHGQ